MQQDQVLSWRIASKGAESQPQGHSGYRRAGYDKAIRITNEGFIVGGAFCVPYECSLSECLASLTTELRVCPETSWDACEISRTGLGFWPTSVGTAPAMGEAALAR